MPANEALDPLGLGIVDTVDPMGGVGSGAPAGVNRAHYLRIIRGGGITISKIRYNVTNQSGNIAVAVYDSSGHGVAAVPKTRLATSGIVACPANGKRDTALDVSVKVYIGYWLCYWVDNTTATVSRYAGLGALNDGMAYEEQSLAGGPPATATPLQATGYLPFLRGIE